MKSRKIIIFIILIFCLFMGIMAVSIGLGAAFPGINQVAKPIVCPDGSMVTETQSYNPFPGKSITTATSFCIDEQTQSKTKVNQFLMHVTSGSIYGLALFLLAGIFLFRRRNAPKP